MAPTGIRVLVTGACGLVGKATVATLRSRGHHVTATDLDTPAGRKTIRQLSADTYDAPGTLAVEWVNLTDADAVNALVTRTAPDAIVHLAAVIPPFCYENRELARAVNVGGTRNLVEAATGVADPPRFVQTSSIAVYGPRNPYAGRGMLRPDTPIAPGDLYGGHKAEADTIVRNSGLEWVILRLGGVLPDSLLTANPRLAELDAVLPNDGHVQSVAASDVATAFANAVTTTQTRREYLIGGDDTHRHVQGPLVKAAGDSLGIGGAMGSHGRPGDPADDTAWFATDWMDCTESQRVLEFQNTTFGELMARGRLGGAKRLAMTASTPIIRAVLKHRSPYRGKPGRYADPWTLIRSTWGDPGPDPESLAALKSPPQ
ncbi:NAD-dependent epimerase/dehydratase family protein [Gordonia pseudamarae]|jgi:nucleoside-diphosphate-sugar epimerase|uniref:NAD-dependent epimerase/dehydratase family protein n=1 Tax=Gordonia pseudamarae TaxID=2831662 RepID=A0ABX6IIC1_9ACTN|nr:MULTISPECIES: NAD-dependent epimerase/dehydratase family protein [Gordonia]MBD0022965.1 NAD(P)-dependent oxidoreductase [Gordonia sp. (in: high G+C Gram-positive bacteria)]QHN26736.1 NAD-dependent epimerase/dehydratase family protein [Gordonia pseudamarae]QHN35629.1 NAD-dependent epimerase/dehydratase family protein [Gordonia pseudamarae]